jgi:penicillin V acylase-like amidase (Ntn superfamily)
MVNNLWRTAADEINKIYYYFYTATRPNTYWVTLAILNFEQNAPILKLALADGEV